MLNHFIKIILSRRMFCVVVVLWILALLSIFTYVSDEVAVVPGGIEHRHNFWEVRRTPIFVWLSFILFGYVAHAVRQRSLEYFGLAEMFFGLVAGYFAVAKMSLPDPSSWVAIATSSFLVVRGATNLSQAAVGADKTDATGSASKKPDTDSRLQG